MSNETIKVSFDPKEISEKLTHLDKNFRQEVHTEIAKIKKNTKSVVRNSLSKGNGIDKGVYKKSIVINTLANDSDKIAFQVGSKKHYRLTHLLEDGHEIWIFIRGKGRPTYKGNVGMNKLSGKTRSIPHIRPGQEYADKTVIEMYKNAWKKALGKEN